MKSKLSDIQDVCTVLSISFVSNRLHLWPIKWVKSAASIVLISMTLLRVMKALAQDFVELQSQWSITGPRKPNFSLAFPGGFKQPFLQTIDHQ